MDITALTQSLDDIDAAMRPQASGREYDALDEVDRNTVDALVTTSRVLVGLPPALRPYTVVVDCATKHARQWYEELDMEVRLLRAEGFMEEVIDERRAVAEGYLRRVHQRQRFATAVADAASTHEPDPDKRVEAMEEAGGVESVLREVYRGPDAFVKAMHGNATYMELSKEHIRMVELARTAAGRQRPSELEDAVLEQSRQASAARRGKPASTVYAERAEEIADRIW